MNITNEHAVEGQVVITEGNVTYIEPPEGIEFKINAYTFKSDN